MNARGEVFVVITFDVDCITDLEILDDMPTWDPPDNQRCFVGNVNGGDSLELPVVRAWAHPNTRRTA